MSPAQCGRLQLSPIKKAFIEIEVVYCKGTVGKDIRSGLVNENDVENADETHFLVNGDNGRTFRFCGDPNVKYADVSVAGKGLLRWLIYWVEGFHLSMQNFGFSN